MISPESRITARLKKRNLPELLVHKFLTEYGYDHGPVIARAIVDDILDTVERCYPKRVSPKTVVWLAVRLKAGDRMKGISISDLVPVQLRVYTEQEAELLTDPALRKRRQARHAFNQARFARWCFEAYEQVLGANPANEDARHNLALARAMLARGFNGEIHWLRGWRFGGPATAPDPCARPAPAPGGAGAHRLV